MTNPLEKTAYEEMVEKYGLIEETMVGTDEDGNYVFVSIDDECACFETSQKNGWTRVNLYHKDGTNEEMFKK